MPQASPSPPISASVASFLVSGLSITLCARSERLVPSIAKAAGCQVSADRRGLSVLLFQEVAEAVCRDIAENGLVAVCFSRPSTNETVQLKGRDARSGRASPLEVAAARRCVDLLIDDLTPLGFGRTIIENIFWRDRSDLLAIRFAPDAAFVQTPGPQAGTVLAR